MLTKYTTAMKINIGSHLHVACNPAALQVLSNLPSLFIYINFSVVERACTYSKHELVLTIRPLVCKVNSFHNFAVDLLRGIVIDIASHVPLEID